MKQRIMGLFVLASGAAMMVGVIMIGTVHGAVLIALGTSGLITAVVLGERARRI